MIANLTCPHCGHVQPRHGPYRNGPEAIDGSVFHANLEAASTDKPANGAKDPPNLALRPNHNNTSGYVLPWL